VNDWPDEPFKAKHDASGTPVKVTPIDGGEPDLLPQSMRVGKGPAQDLHWVDLNEARYLRVQKWLEAANIASPFVPSDIAGRASLLFVFDLLLARLDQHEHRIARLETPPKPPEGT